MFVPYEKESLFEVERHSDRCICGKSAILSTDGYCASCLEEKENLINYLVDKIETSNPNYNVYILQSEVMRTFILKQALSTLIDRYFVKQENANEKSSENRNFFDKYLYIACLEEKIKISNMILEEIKSTFRKDEKISNIAYQNAYYNDIFSEIMWDSYTLKSEIDNNENSDSEIQKKLIFICSKNKQQ